MSLRIRGNHPDARVGESFEVRELGSWSSLAGCVLDLAPVEAGEPELWYDIDADVLDAEGCVKLVNRLEHLLEGGSVARYVADRNTYLAEHPRPECSICGGTGIRCDELGQLRDYPKRVVTNKPAGNPRAGQVGWCDRCEGWGTVKNYGTYRDLYESDVREFGEFLRHAGGLWVFDLESYVNSDRYRSMA